MSSEESLPYDGPLSTYSEWHSALLGVAAGLAAGWSKTLRRDIRKEPHLFVAGLLAGVWIGTKLRGD